MIPYEMQLMAEIRRSPVDVGSLSHHLQGFFHIPGGWQDFCTINSSRGRFHTYSEHFFIFFLLSESEIGKIMSRNFFHLVHLE